jgi:2-succinyl-5-enolpyruvyl-6-hydroxy-3-cyclohexene-1-carboxylate synthase
MTPATDPCDVGASNLAFARALVGALVGAGVTRAYVCPGSRSTPLALAVATQPGLRYSVQIDERSAAFHALGHARVTGRPAVLICTSGTAGANFLPAVAEASRSRVPLLVLTADRPPELRSWGAPQTMEQRGLYAGFTRWSEEAPCPSESGGGQRYAIALARRAFRAATGPAPGPVHLNLPFREPLVPAAPDVDQSHAGEIVPNFAADGAVASSAGDVMTGALASVSKGVLVVGPDACDPSLADAVRRFSAARGWPVLADPASGLRAGLAGDDAPIAGADLLLREPAAAAALRPELVVRLGGVPTSAAISNWLARQGEAELWLVDPSDDLRDPQHRASRVWRMTSTQFCLAASDSGAPGTRTLDWRARWRRLEAVAREALAAALAAEPSFRTPQLARTLWERLPSGAVLYAANSMPIRELDAFAGPRDEPLTVLANRGVNGIDGLVSSALGAAEASARHTVLWCGDLALLHDVAGLLAGRLADASLTVVVSNDDGGGIFEHLPVARAIPRPLFERLFGVPHGLDVCALAQGLGWTATQARSEEAFVAALARAAEGGRQLIEVPVDRAANTAFHRAIHAEVATRVRGALEQ